MSGPRIGSIKCPSCNGTGKNLFDPCMWCEGSKKLRYKTALRWADASIMLGSGGYVCGDHDWDDRCRMVNEGNAVRKAFGLEPR